MSRPIDEQIILVTGSTDGIGKGTARELARRGVRVLLHGRDAGRLETVRQEIAGATGNDRLETYVADFASLAAVRGLAEQVKARHDRLDVLIKTPGLAPAHAAARVASSAPTATSSASRSIISLPCC